jgi:hypothetical protein
MLSLVILKYLLVKTIKIAFWMPLKRDLRFLFINKRQENGRLPMLFSDF